MPPQALEERVAFVEGELSGLRKTVERIEARVDHLELVMNQRFNQLEARITSLEEKFDRRFEALDRRFEAMETRIHNIFVAIGIGFSVLVALIAIFKFV